MNLCSSLYPYIRVRIRNASSRKVKVTLSVRIFETAKRTLMINITSIVQSFQKDIDFFCEYMYNGRLWDGSLYVKAIMRMNWLGT